MAVCRCRLQKAARHQAVLIVGSMPSDSPKAEPISAFFWGSATLREAPPTPSYLSFKATNSRQLIDHVAVEEQIQHIDATAAVEGNPPVDVR